MKNSSAYSYYQVSLNYTKQTKQGTFNNYQHILKKVKAKTAKDAAIIFAGKKLKLSADSVSNGMSEQPFTKDGALYNQWSFYCSGYGQKIYVTCQI